MSLKDTFLQQFPKQELGENYGIQQDALKALNNLDFPTTRDEYWKYTRVNKILKQSFSFEKVDQLPSVKDLLIPNLEATLLVFINGLYVDQLSDIKKQQGLNIFSLEEATNRYSDFVKNNFGQHANYKDQIFTALNTAYHNEGIFINVDANTILDYPIHILHLTTSNSIVNSRNLFHLAKNSQAQIITTNHTIKNGVFINNVSEIVIEENAQLEHNLLQIPKNEIYQVNEIDVQQKNNSRYTQTTITIGGDIIRNNTNVSVDGTACETNLFGTYLAKNSQHIDNHTLIDHKQPHCESNELYKGIMDDKSTGVFNGKVFVQRAAQKTNAFQSNQNILLDDNATINSKPELEIYADDVKCSHGSTTGQLDEEALFYLRSRGVSKENAKKLLVKAFTSDTLEKLSSEAVKEHVSELIEESLDN